MLCPNCGKQMSLRTRRSDGNKFWGCSGFPVCRFTRDYQETSEEVQPDKGFKPSQYQQAIFDYIMDPNGTDGVIEAVAGSGKTTTIVQALKFTSGKVAFVAFNKRIAEELKKRAPSHVKCCTLHSLGFACLNRAFETRPIVDEHKKDGISRELLPDDDDKYARLALVKLASLIQATLVDPNDVSAVAELIERFDVELNGCEERVLGNLARMIDLCASRTGVVDFDDMCWMPVYLHLPLERYDWLMVDESQDLNHCQLELIKSSVNEYGRIIAVGDRFQSIYGFRGADTNAIPSLIEGLNDCKVMPLSITYRCPISHVRLARQFVSALEPREDAPEGIVENLPYAKVVAEAQSGDMILCRINAPLIEMCYSLIRAGKKAIIVGRDIGKGLLALIDKMRPSDINDLLTRINEYKFKEMTKLTNAGKSNQAASLEDRVECIIALCDGVDNMSELRARIETIFSDEIVGIACSSVHRAKGLESENVFILKPELMPFPKAKQDWQIEQERNIQYVAYTRSKSRLVFIQ